MSHWTKIKLNINNKDTLVKALQRMGLKPEVGTFTISEYGQSSTAEIKVDKSVGFAQAQDGTFSMVGDFYHAGVDKLRKYYGNNNLFTQDLNAAYGIEHAKAQLETLGGDWFIEENAEAVVGKDGMIRMVAVSYT